MRSVLVTGGTRGIGRAIAQAFAPDHAVSVTHRTTAPDALLSICPDVFPIHVNLEEPTAPAQIVDQVLDRWGRIDVIVNNAGVVAADDGARNAMWQVNVEAPMALVEAALPHLAAGAAIVNISSVNAKLPAMGAAAYSASKAAVNTWTRGLAKTLGPRGIRVNAVAPGAIEREESPRPPELVRAFVEMTALGRVGAPEDIARVVRFLASDEAAFITGEILTVSGGYRL